MLTLVVPTYNRHHYLDRIFSYYGNSDFHVVIADGSNSPLDPTKVASLPKNIIYHYEQTDPNQRIINTIPLIRTPYACLLGDDELHLISTLRECIHFLDSHVDYVSCSGTPLGFKYSNDHSGMDVKSIYPEFKSHIINQDSFADRLYSHFNPYVCSSVYGVLRTPTFKTAALASNIKTSCVYVPEIAFELSNSTLGKLHILQKISWLRNYDVPPISNKTWNRQFRFHHWYNNLKYLSEKKSWINTLCNLLEPHADSNLKKSIEDTLNAYVSKFPMSKPNRIGTYLNSAKNSVKSILGKSIKPKASPFGKSLETERRELIKLNSISDLNDFNSAFELIKKDREICHVQQGSQ